MATDLPPADPRDLPAAIVTNVQQGLARLEGLFVRDPNA